LSSREIRVKRPELLETVGLAKWGSAPVKKYSKGMLQRLGLAQAMLHDPELLILDEPTDGVDPVGRSEMRVLLERLKAAGKTVFLNSHLLQEVELICDRVVILDHGRALKEGRIHELTQQPGTDVTLVVLGDEAELQNSIGSRAVESFLPMGENQFEVTLPVDDQGSIDALVDDLRRRGLSLVSLARRRQTLEEAFLRIIQEARRSA
jgi:ABC-2 type transport system ATP-binding protein